MVYYDSTYSQGIVQDALFTIFAKSTDNAQYPTADITRSVNRWYDVAVSKILEADGRWQWDSSNTTDLPIATTNLVSGQQDYGLDTSFLKITRVEILDQSGTGRLITPIDQADIWSQATSEYLKNGGTPLYYDKLANSIFLYPVPNYNSTNGLKVFFQRNVTYFSATDTTTSPGFASNFHRLLSLGAAYDFMVARNLPQANRLREEIEKMTVDLQTFYSRRAKDENIHLGVRRQIWR
jgi:hypothetical protein